MKSLLRLGLSGHFMIMKSSSFTDFDSFVESVRDVDADMMFQNPRNRTWSIQRVNLPRVHIQLGQLGSGNIVEGQSSSSGYLLYLPLTDGCAYSANGTVVGYGSFATLEPGCEFCVATKSEHDWCTIHVPSELVEGGHGERSRSKMRCRVSPKNIGAATKFCLLVNQTISTATKHAKFESSPAAARVEEELLRIVFEVLEKPTDRYTLGRPKITRQEIIRRCQHFLEEHEGNTLTVSDLLGVAGVSGRTLRRAFNDYYGVTPVAYLQLRQLHQIHRILKAAKHDETKVSDVLFDNAIYDLGHFAARYRRLFGELPSETLITRR